MMAQPHLRLHRTPTRGHQPRADQCLAAGLRQGFVDYFIRIKQGELARYQTEVTDWEQREYFELF